LLGELVEFQVMEMFIQIALRDEFTMLAAGLDFALIDQHYPIARSQCRNAVRHENDGLARQDSVERVVEQILDLLGEWHGWLFDDVHRRIAEDGAGERDA